MKILPTQKTTLKARVTTLAFTVASLITLGFGANASAQSPIIRGAQAAQGTGQPSELFGDTGIITSATNTLLFVVGALSVIMIIFGGLRYATSGGSSSAVTAAKNTVLYALVGLIIAFLAFAAVNWVLGVLVSGGGTNV